MKSKFKIILINIMILFLILIVLDPIVGYFTNSQNSINHVQRSIILREHSPNLDIIFRPSNSHLQKTQNLEGKNYKFRTDSNGFIVGPNSIDSSIDIMFFGGSTTACIYVDEELRWPYLVSQLLVNQKGQKINTINAGSSGNNSIHSILNLIAKGLECKPRIVTLMHNVNDLSHLIKTKSYWNSPATRAIIQLEKVKSKKDWALVFLRAVKNLTIPNIYENVRIVFENISEIFKSHPATADEWVNFRNIAFNPEDFGEIQNQYKSSLITFVNVTKSWGIEPILMTQFNRLNIEDTFIRNYYNTSNNSIPYEDFVKYYNSFNAIVRDVANSENCILIDLANEIPPTSEYIYDPAHVNNQGSILVAKTIAKIISENFNDYKLEME